VYSSFVFHVSGWLFPPPELFPQAYDLTGSVSPRPLWFSITRLVLLRLALGKVPNFEVIGVPMSNKHWIYRS
jgi:hypothetical protein